MDDIPLTNKDRGNMNPTTEQTTQEREQGACAALAQAEGARA